MGGLLHLAGVVELGRVDSLQTDGDTAMSPDDTSTADIPVLTESTDPIAQFFTAAYLAPAQQVIARPYTDVAAWLLTLPRNPERTVALRKLLESMDAALRAVVARDVRNI